MIRGSELGVSMLKRLFVTFSLFALLSVSASAQLATTTSLVGTVSDSSGKSIPNAKVTAVETGTLTTQTASTNEAGYFSIDFVRVGVYDVTVEQSGFQKVTKTGVPVSVNQTVRTDFKLAIGTILQTVTVQAEVTANKRDDATVSENLGSCPRIGWTLRESAPLQWRLGNYCCSNEFETEPCA